MQVKVSSLDFETTGGCDQSPKTGIAVAVHKEQCYGNLDVSYCS